MALVRIDLDYIALGSLAEWEHKVDPHYKTFPLFYKEIEAALRGKVEGESRNTSGYGGTALRIMKIIFTEYEFYFPVHVAIADRDQFEYNRENDYVGPVCPPSDRRFDGPVNEYNKLCELEKAFNPSFSSLGWNDLNQLAMKIAPEFSGFKNIDHKESLSLNRARLYTLFKQHGLPMPPESEMIPIFGEIKL